MPLQINECNLKVDDEPLDSRIKQGLLDKVPFRHQITFDKILEHFFTYDVHFHNLIMPN